MFLVLPEAGKMEVWLSADYLSAYIKHHALALRTREEHSAVIC